MDKYKRGKQVEESLDRSKIPIPNLPEDFVWIQVSSGSKMKNLLECAIKSLEEDKAVVWTGVGDAVGKTISCAEISKRKYKAHQITKICYHKIEDHWDPLKPELEPLIVRRDVPTIHILVSRQELNVNELGYQGPGRNQEFWPARSSEKPHRSRPGSEHSRQNHKRAHLLKQLTAHD